MCQRQALLSGHWGPPISYVPQQHALLSATMASALLLLLLLLLSGHQGPCTSYVPQQHAFTFRPLRPRHFICANIKHYVSATKVPAFPYVPKLPAFLSGHKGPGTSICAKTATINYLSAAKAPALIHVPQKQPSPSDHQGPSTSVLCPKIANQCPTTKAPVILYVSKQQPKWPFCHQGPGISVYAPTAKQCPSSRQGPGISACTSQQQQMSAQPPRGLGSNYNQRAQNLPPWI